MRSPLSGSVATKQSSSMLYTYFFLLTRKPKQRHAADLKLMYLAAGPCVASGGRARQRRATRMERVRRPGAPRHAP